MNYVIVVIAIVTIMCAITWIVDGKKNFTGPPHDTVLYAEGIEIAAQAGEHVAS